MYRRNFKRNIPGLEYKITVHRRMSEAKDHLKSCISREHFTDVTITQVEKGLLTTLSNNSSSARGLLALD